MVGDEEEMSVKAKRKITTILFGIKTSFHVHNWMRNLECDPRGCGGHVSLIGQREGAIFTSQDMTVDITHNPVREEFLLKKEGRLKRQERREIVILLREKALDSVLIAPSEGCSSTNC